MEMQSVTFSFGKVLPITLLAACKKWISDEFDYNSIDVRFHYTTIEFSTSSVRKIHNARPFSITCLENRLINGSKEGMKI